MGMFSKLFGSSSSDKADKMRQAAIDAFNAIQTPALKDMQIQLDKYVSAGQLTPEQAEAELLSSNAFNDIVTDPALAGAQKQALAALQEVGTQGGMTAIDRARMQDITNEQNQLARGRRESVMGQARQRGVGGSDVELVNQLMEEQAAADRASQQGTDVAAEAQARALQALMAAGQTAGQIRGQEYGEQADKAQAENAIDLFNKTTLNQTNLYNVDAANRAKAANLQNEQNILNANVGQSTDEKKWNAQQVQQQFANEIAKAGGKAGTYNAWADDATAAKRAEKGADQALLGTGIGAAFTASGGPAAGVAANMATNPGMDIGGGRTTNPAYDYDKVMGTQYKYDGGEVTMDKDEFKDEHNRLLNVLENPSPMTAAEEAERQRKEMAEYGMNCGGVVKMNQGGATPPLPITPEENGQGFTILDPKGQVVGSFPSYAEAAQFAEKVKTKQPNVADFRNGGSVPGQAPIPGDHPANDIVPAKLSPGEVVVPRTAMTDDEEFDAFMEKFRPSRRPKPANTDAPLMVQALQNLKTPMNRMEGR